MTVVTILDDYQSVALSSADWSRLGAGFDIRPLTEFIGDTDELVSTLADSDVVIAMRERTAFPEAVLKRLPNLRLLITTGMNNKSMDMDAAARLGIVVAGTRGEAGAVPELTIGMMITLTRHLAEEDRSMREGGWQHTIGPTLGGLTLGLLGLGNQGAGVAKLANAFGMKVIAWSPSLTPEKAAEHGALSVTKEQIFTDSDIVSVHTALKPETRDLVGEAELRMMRPTSYLINTARGPIVTERALVEALQQNRIAGAALDVFDQEPLPADHVLRTLPNTLLLPHIGYVSSQGYRTYYEGAIEDIEAWLAGTPRRVLNAPRDPS